MVYASTSCIRSLGSSLPLSIYRQCYDVGSGVGFRRLGNVGRNSREPKRQRWKSEPMKALRVLIMEDDPLIGMLLVEWLEEMGFGVCAVAATVVDAVTAAAQNRPDLVIADARLGGGSGISAI